ncbi:NADH dehydrogenase subunit 3 (mitochondrion) [Muscidifurax raptorellus]|uniref:NADH dehydrogenase subunit 3 n=1 Tax=Muscidifurax raptorellus TaxID=51938 RepID=UPI001E7E1608|nr:NADH dehydrogenase subunit 3 [Muscidifurax raptorellus]UAT98641.1 NADH dehydrogenase subunit 3 [Muscidifurax raptorellus]
MIIFLSLIMLILLILTIMLSINLLISKKMNKNREKNSPFECGFDPMSNNRLPFSLSFYLISIIFLIFDVEIALILPMTFFTKFYTYYYYINIILIIIILLMGLFIEWKEGALKWIK